MHLQGMDKSFSAILLYLSFSSDGARIIDFHSAEVTVLLNFLVTVAQEKWLFSLFTKPLQLLVEVFYPHAQSPFDASW